MGDLSGAETDSAPLWRRILPWVVAAVALGGSVYGAYRSGVHWSLLWQIGPLEVAGVFALVALNIGLNAAVNRAVLSGLGAHLSAREAYALSAAGAWLNKIFPLQSGAVGRALYLKRRHGVAYSRFIGVQAAVYTLKFVVAGIL